MLYSILTAVTAVVFLCIGYHFGRATVTGQDALQPLKQITEVKTQDDEIDPGFYNR